MFGHGLLFGGWVFGPQVAALREHYRCVAIDWRGQGATPAAPSGYDMDTLTLDALALIGRLGAGPVHWVGLSMGGFVGLRLGARHGAVLRSLTLLDTSTGPEVPHVVGDYRRLALAARIVGIRPVVGRVEPLMFGPAFRAERLDVIEDWALRLARADRAGLRRAVLGVADRAGVEDELPTITVPTLVVVVVGADDVATPPVEAERIAARIPGAHVEIVAHCGHTSPLEQPATITGLLVDFLAGAADPRVR